MSSKPNVTLKGLVGIIPILLAFIENEEDHTIIGGTTIAGTLAIEETSLNYNIDHHGKNLMQSNSYLKPKNDHNKIRDSVTVDESPLNHNCDLLGPRVPEDETDETIENFTKRKMALPPSLENEIVLDLPVGFFRLRTAFLSSTSSFWTKSILQSTLRYTEVNSTGWLHPHEHHIGHVAIPSHVRTEGFIGARRDTSYRMPAGRLVAANMAYETCTLTDYADDYFVLSMTTSTPSVPFGKRFLAKTQMVVVRTGKNRCRMICSVETEFPNGAPLGMKGQIKMGMMRGTIEMFQKIGSCVRHYSNF